VFIFDFCSRYNFRVMSTPWCSCWIYAVGRTLPAARISCTCSVRLATTTASGVPPASRRSSANRASYCIRLRMDGRRSLMSSSTGSLRRPSAPSGSKLKVGLPLYTAIASHMGGIYVVFPTRALFSSLIYIPSHLGANSRVVSHSTVVQEVPGFESRCRRKVLGSD